MKKNWYAVYTKPKAEKKVCASLSRKKIESFCPMNRVIKSGSFDRKRLMSEPLFPNYVFVYITEQEIPLIRQNSDIINFLYWLGRPVTIRENEIDNIRDFSNQYMNITLEKTQVSLNKMVRIVNRVPFVGEDNNIYQMNSALVKVTLPTLGYNICAMSSVEHAELQEISFGVRNLVS